MNERREEVLSQTDRHRWFPTSTQHWLYNSGQRLNNPFEPQSSHVPYGFLPPILLESQRIRNDLHKSPTRSLAKTAFQKLGVFINAEMLPFQKYHQGPEDHVAAETLRTATHLGIPLHSGCV